MDVLDFKVGTGLGLGVKAELTTYFGIGAGAGLVWYYEKFGRELEDNGGFFLHLAAAGLDGFSGHGHLDEAHLFGLSISQLNRPATFDVARIGAEVLLPGVTGGLYLNLGQFGDFLAGFFRFDPAGDDKAPSKLEEPLPSSAPGADVQAPERMRLE